MTQLGRCMLHAITLAGLPAGIWVAYVISKCMVDQTVLTQFVAHGVGIHDGVN